MVILWHTSFLPDIFNAFHWVSGGKHFLWFPWVYKISFLEKRLSFIRFGYLVAICESCNRFCLKSITARSSSLINGNLYDLFHLDPLVISRFMRVKISCSDWNGNDILLHNKFDLRNILMWIPWLDTCQQLIILWIVRRRSLQISVP